MTTFDWHIVRRFAQSFVLFIVALIVFFIVLHWVEYSDDFLDHGATTWEVFSVFYPNYIPEIVRLISPLAVFLSCIYLTGTLAQELQLIALQTSGVSLYRILRPFALFGLVVSVGMFFFNGWVVPKTNEVVVRYENEYLHRGDSPVDVSEIHRQNGPHSILSVGYYDRKRQRGHRVSLQHFASSTRLERRLDARRMLWIDSLQTWRFEGAQIRVFDSTGTLASVRAASRVDTSLQVYPRDLARSQNDVAAMTIPAAREYLGALQRSGASHLNRPLIAYYNKYAYPTANLILVLIGVPLAAVRRRGGQATHFAIGLMTAFLYLAAQKLTEPFGYTGALSPRMTAWMPHVLFALIALGILWRTRK
jgi:lipopolysaccharide export system permease protein